MTSGRVPDAISAAGRINGELYLMNAKTLIFVPLSLAFASAPALSLTLDDISTKLSAIKTVKANFTSERNLKGAPKPLVAKGRMTLIEGKGRSGVSN